MDTDITTLKLVFKLMPEIDHTFFAGYFKDFHVVDNLNKTHIKTLMAIKFEGPLPMSHISQKLSLEKGSFTPVAKKLIKLGYIKKVQSEEDRRISLLSLTDEGRIFTNRLHEGHLTYLENQFNKLTKEEHDIFESAIKTVFESVEKINERD